MPDLAASVTTACHVPDAVFRGESVSGGRATQQGRERTGFAGFLRLSGKRSRRRGERKVPVAGNGVSCTERAGVRNPDKPGRDDTIAGKRFSPAIGTGAGVSRLYRNPLPIIRTVLVRLPCPDGTGHGFFHRQLHMCTAAIFCITKKRLDDDTGCLSRYPADPVPARGARGRHAVLPGRVNTFFRRAMLLSAWFMSASGFGFFIVRQGGRLAGIAAGRKQFIAGNGLFFHRVMQVSAVETFFRVVYGTARRNSG